jgi:hypothetical protein
MHRPPNEKAATRGTAFLSPDDEPNYVRGAALRFAAVLRFAGVLRFAAVLMPALRLEAARAFGGRPGFAFALVFALVFSVPIMAESSSRR